MTKILFCGDPHGDVEPIKRTILTQRVNNVILLGDQCFDEHIDKVFAEELSLGVNIYFIRGNHDFNHAVWLDNLDSEKCIDLHGRVADIGGVLVAGLGGNFQGTIWNPKDGPGEPRFESREDFLGTLKHHNRIRKGLPLKRCGAIWYDEYVKMSKMRADIVVTHEGPSTHPYGFAEIEALGYDMGCHTIAHGHLHTTYQARVAGMKVVGLDKDDSWLYVA